MDRDMQSMKSAVAKNLAELRRINNMTQLELAERLNYTDKAVSKWERGESLPDVLVLKQIAELFHVTVDYLLSEEHSEPVPPAPVRQTKVRTHTLITFISIFLVSLIATFVFFVLAVAPVSLPGAWLSFIYAVPVSMIVWLVFNSVWFNQKRNFLIISLLMWSLLCAIHLTFVVAGINVALIYILGVPGQMIILLWSGIGRKKK